MISISIQIASGCLTLHLWFRRLFSLVIVALTPFLGGCGGDAYRYRLTVEVDDDGVIKSGWSVLEATPRFDYSLGDAGRILSIGVRGEAVFVDLGNGRNVIALLAAGSFAEKDLPMKFLLRHRSTNQEIRWTIGKLFSAKPGSPSWIRGVIRRS